MGFTVLYRRQDIYLSKYIYEVHILVTSIWKKAHRRNNKTMQATPVSSRSTQL